MLTRSLEDAMLDFVKPIELSNAPRMFSRVGDMAELLVMLPLGKILAAGKVVVQPLVSNNFKLTNKL